MTGRPGGPTPGSTEGLTVPQVIQATRIIWFGMLMAQISFGLVIALIGGPLWKGPGPSPLSMPLSLMLGAFVVATIAVQAIFRRNFVAEVRGRAEQLRQEADPLASVLVPYRGLFITTFGLVEGGSLFGLVSYLAAGVTLGLVVSAASVAWFLMNFPTEDGARRLVQNAIESA